MSGARLESLAAIESALWGELRAAVCDRAHPWRTPVLATTDGEAGDARTVVLRGVNRDQQHLLFYSDARAPKRSQLAAHPLATLVFWSPALAWQLRVRVHCAVQVDGLAASSHWERLRLTAAAQDYLSLAAPGNPLETPHGQRGERGHFALVEAHVRSIDWLELHAQGHRRARFELADRRARWLQP